MINDSNEPVDGDPAPGLQPTLGGGQPPAPPTPPAPPAAPEPNPDPGPDPFDPDSLRLSQDPAAGMGVRKTLLSVPVRKPDRSWFIRVNPDPRYHLQTAVIVLKMDRGEETYLVAPALRPDLAAESTFSARAIYTCISREGVVFLWSIRLPGPDGRVDEWSRTALEAADLATKGWVRVAANKGLGAYDVFQATGNLPEPEWPTVPFKELLRVAFKDRLIDDLNHPVLRKLRGEV